MNRQVNDPDAVPCMVLAFSPEEMEIVKQVLEEDGYEDDLKQWILDNMMGDEDREERYKGAADRVIKNVSEFVNENPDTIRAASMLAGNLLKRAIKKGPR